VLIAVVMRAGFGVSRVPSRTIRGSSQNDQAISSVQIAAYRFGEIELDVESVTQSNRQSSKRNDQACSLLEPQQVAVNIVVPRSQLASALNVQSHHEKKFTSN
jgi:hypothetical protein